MVRKQTKKLTRISTLEIKSLYNIVRMVGVEELPNIAKILNKKTILVLMQRKKKRTEQMPEWFKKGSKDSFEPRIKAIETRLDNHEKLFRSHGGIK